MLAGRELAELCDEQGVRLNSHIDYTLRLPIYSSSGFFPVLEAIEGIQRTSWERGLSIADRPIEITERLNQDTPIRILTAIINSSVERDVPSKVVRLPYRKSAAEACAEAEGKFYDTLKSLGTMSRTGLLRKSTGAQILTGANGPIAIRKQDGEKTALTLEPLAISGVVFPAGSIVTVAAKPPQPRVELLPVEEVRGAAFRRASYICLTPEERLEFTEEQPGDAYRKIRTLDMDLIQAKSIVLDAFEKLSTKRKIFSMFRRG